MQKPIFKYYLFSEAKKPLYLDANGNVQEGNAETLLQQDGITPARLLNAPEGWQGTLIKYFRNIVRWGVLRDMSSPMKFTGDAAQIIRHYKWTYGSEAVLYFGIAKLDQLSQPDKYKVIYLSELNLYKTKQVRGGMQCEAMEGGLSKYLKAFESTRYDIPLDDYQAFYTRFDGAMFDYSRTYTVMPDQGFYNTQYYIGIVEKAREGATGAVPFYDVQPTEMFPNPDDSFFSQPTVSKDMTIEGILKMEFLQDDSILVKIKVGTAWNSVTEYTLFNVSRTAGTIENFTFSQTFNVPANHKVWFHLSDGSAAIVVLQSKILEGEIRVTYQHRQAASNAKCMTPYRLAQLITEKMTDGQYEFESDWLRTEKDMAITCGDALRGLTGCTIKSSFNDLFKTLNRFSAGVGLGVLITGNKLRIEPLSYFFINEIGIALEEVSNFEIFDAEDLLFNTIKCGNEKKDYTDTNGKYEFNQGQVWTTPRKKDVKELDLLSVYRTDTIGAEICRINFDGKKTTDSESDNDVWLFHKEQVASGTVNEGPETFQLFDIYHPPFTSATGLPNWETWYNTLWTPVHSLLANGAYIRSVLDYMDTGLLKQASADKNKDFTSTIGGVTVSQSADIQIGSLAARIFRPYYFTFRTQVPITLPDIMASNPYKKVSFKYNGITYYGWLMDGGIQPADNDSQTWKLLCTGDTDVSKLIKNHK